MTSVRLFAALLMLTATSVHAATATASQPATQPATLDVPIVFGRLQRHYLLHVPAALDRSKPAPLVIMLHGAGGTAAGSAIHYGWTELADRDGFIVVFPEGTRFAMNRPPRFDVNPCLWNDGSGRGFAGWQRVDDIGYLRAVLDDVAKRCNVDSARVYCTGFSNGASMTFRAGVELCDRFAAIAPLSGHFWLKDAKLATPVPLFFLMGTADPLNPIDGGMAASPWGDRPEQKPPMRASTEAWLKLLNLDNTSHTLRDDEQVHAVRYGDEGSAREVVVYTIQNLGHEWPGHGRVLPQMLTGPQSNAVDATQLVWAFFKQHSRKNPS